jgi:acyl carrier protein
LRSHISESLPHYMVASQFVFMESFPLTINGKLDRDKLPLPTGDRPRLAVEYVAPQPGLEEQLAKLWRSALRLNSVGVNDNIFDLGADSLKVTAVHRVLQEELSQKVAITDLFEFATIAALASKLSAKNSAPDSLRDKAQSRAELQRAALARMRRPANPTEKR